MTLSCSLWEYDDPSNPLEQKTPETYLSLIATDTIFRYPDPATGGWSYDLGNSPDPNQILLDTLENAFTDTFTSRHELHWWGEDSDGEVMGYQYRWKDGESGIFSNAINVSGGNTDYDLVFGFSPYATDGYDSGIDLYASPAPPPPAFDAALFWDNNRYYTQILYGPAQDTVEWDIQLQYPEDNTIILTWDNTDWDTLSTFIVQDAFGGLLGIDVDMTVETSLTLTDSMITILKLKVIPEWSFTKEESGLFYVPIRTSFDVFGFEVRAMDNDSLFDPTPSNVVFPVKNSPPSVSFRYLSNPQIADIQGDTAFTFSTRTFVWDADDQDGVETITNVLYALDETCDTCWIQLGAESSVTLNETELDPGFHTFYLKVKDIAGAESFIVSFPDTLNEDEPNYWKVMPVVGNVLLVDDFPLDGYNNSQMWFRTVLESIVGGDNYSVWEIGDELPFSSTDITANLNYFDHVIWNAAYNNTGAASDTYLDASSNILSYVMGGGNLFLDAIDWDDDSTFAFFPIDSSFIINTNGRLMMGRALHSQVDSTLDLELSKLIAVRVKSFIPATEDSTSFPHFESEDLYHLQESESGLDTWTGTPNVCSIGKFVISPSQESGKIILMSIPLHNGYDPTLEGNGSAGKFIEYLLNEVFVE